MNVINHVLLHSLISLLCSCSYSVAQLNHLHPDELRAELFASCFAWHVDIETTPLDLCAGIGDNIFSRVLTGSPDSDAGAQGKDVRIGGDYMPVRQLSGRCDSGLCIRRCAVRTVG